MNIKRYIVKGDMKIRRVLRGGIDVENTVRRLDFSKLKFSDEIISTKEALKDVSPFNFNKDEKIIVTGIADGIGN